MTAWSGAPLPVHKIQVAMPLEREGANVFQGKQCRNCHMVGGNGGQRGPALDNVATRLTYDQLVRQVIQGGGNMPAYGKNLSPAETTALVSFLETMHPSNQPPARNPTLPVPGEYGPSPDNTDSPLSGSQHGEVAGAPQQQPAPAPAPKKGPVKVASAARGDSNTISMNNPSALPHAH